MGSGIMETKVSLPPVSIAVIGGPGQGKSAFLNGLAKKRDAFKTGGGGQSCTKNVSAQQFDLDGLKVTLTDTMGFPDPDPQYAESYYNQVVAACNAPLNAIVWLIRMEREIPQVLDMYSVLLKEFANANPPIIIVVNGFQCYEDDEEREEKKAEHLKLAYDFGMSVAKKIEMPCAKIIVGAEKVDLKEKVRRELGATLAGTMPKTSNIKSFAQLGAELSGCQSAEELAARAKRREEAELRKVEADKQAKEQMIADLGNKKDETKQVYYRDWYKLWMGGHYETEWAHDRVQVQREIDEAKIREEQLKSKMKEKEMTAAEKQRVFDERVKQTKNCQSQYERLKRALVGQPKK